MTRVAAGEGLRNHLSASYYGLVDVFFLILMVMVLTAPIATDNIALMGSTGGQDMAGGGNIARQLAYMTLSTGILYGTRACRDLRIFSLAPRALFAVLALCWVSLAWSIEPGVAFRRIVLTTAIIFSVILAVEHLGREKIFFQLGVLLAAICMMDFVAVALFPGIGVHQLEAYRDNALVGNWRGIFPEKNSTGLVCAATILLFFFEGKGFPIWVRSAVVSASALFLWETQSKTSIGLVLIAIVLGYMFKFYNRRYAKFVLMLSLGLALALLLFCILNWDQIVAPLDREDTLTGRSQIWRVLISYIEDNWLLGCGYGSFWNTGQNSPVIAMVRPGSWLQDLASGHNGYLDVAIQLGIPGLALTAYAYFFQPISSLFANQSFQRGRGSFYFALLIFGLGYNVTESAILDRDNLLQVLLALTICLIHMERDPSEPDLSEPGAAQRLLETPA